MGRRPRIRTEEQAGGGENSTPSPPLPAAIRLMAPHGFLESVHNKGTFLWVADEVVTNPATIALLIERGASWEPVECSEAPASPPHL